MVSFSALKITVYCIGVLTYRFSFVTNHLLSLLSLFLLCFSMQYRVPLSPLTNPSAYRISTPIILSTSAPSPPLSPHKRVHTSHSHMATDHSGHMTGPVTAPVTSASHFAFDFPSSSPLPEDSVAHSSPPPSTTRSTTSPVKVTLPTQHRRSSDSDISCTPPKGRLNYYTYVDSILCFIDEIEFI